MVLFSEDTLKINDKLFLFAKNLNVFFSVDLFNGNLNFLGSIPEEEAFCERLTCKLVYWEKQIIIVPLMAKKIWIYSLENGKWRNIVIKAYKSGDLDTNFRQAIIYHNVLFLFGGHYPAILKMDLNSYKVSYIEEPFLRYSDNNNETRELYFRGDFVYRKDILYLAASRENSVFKFNLDTEKYEWIEVGGKQNRYSGIMWDGDNYWLSPRKSTPIVKWNGEKEFTEYEIPIDKRTDTAFYSGVLKKEQYIIIPALDKTGAYTIILTQDGKMECNENQYMFYKRTEQKEYLFQEPNGRLIYIDYKGIRKKFDLNIHGDLFCRLLDSLKVPMNDLREKMFYENNLFSERELSDWVSRKDRGLLFEKEDCGLKIWRSIKT